MYVEHHYSGVADGEWAPRVHQVRLEAPKWLVRFDAQALVGTGSSGILMFGALSLIAPDIPMVWCRKHNENSHGGIWSGNEAGCYLARSMGSNPLRRLVMLDDFVSSGTTVATIQNTLDYTWQRKGGAWEDRPQIVACMAYNGQGPKGERERWLHIPSSQVWTAPANFHEHLDLRHTEPFQVPYIVL